MYTQIKLPHDPNPNPADNDNVWLAVPDPDDASRFMLARNDYNLELWRNYSQKWEPGSKIGRRLALIVGHLHTEPEQQEIERRNNRRAVKRLEAVKLAAFNTVLPSTFRVQP